MATISNYSYRYHTLGSDRGIGAPDTLLKANKNRGNNAPRRTVSEDHVHLLVSSVTLPHRTEFRLNPKRCLRSRGRIRRLIYGVEDEELLF